MAKPKTQDNAMVSTLTKLMADTYALAAKTHGAHWNVTGPSFFSLHAAFEAQYDALYTAADDLAERLRALGVSAPHGLAELTKLSSLPPIGGITDGVALAAALATDHRTLGKACRAALAVADDANDDPTADLLTTRAEEHEKTAWMLGAVAG